MLFPALVFIPRYVTALENMNNKKSTKAKLVPLCILSKHIEIGTINVK